MANNAEYKTRVHEAKSRNEINNALTIGEVADGWHKHRKTVLLAINTGRLCARKAGDVWLISYHSAMELWGKPVEMSHPYPF